MKNKQYAAVEESWTPLSRYLNRHVGLKNEYDPSFISKSTQALHKISKSVVTGPRNAGKSDTRQATIADPKLPNPQPPVKSSSNQRLDSTTTSMFSSGGMTFNSQYRNVRTYSNLYANPSKGFALPNINMKNTSIFYEKQRLGVGTNINLMRQRSTSPNQNESQMNYILNTGDYTETIYEEPSSSESKTWTKEMLEKNLPVIGNSSVNQKVNPVIESHLDCSLTEVTENIDYALSKAKTVTKSGYFHGNDNIILIFRSFEILISCYEDENLLNRKKKFSPIYVPVEIASKLYKFNTKELLLCSMLNTPLIIKKFY